MLIVNEVTIYSVFYIMQTNPNSQSPFTKEMIDQIVNVAFQQCKTTEDIHNFIKWLTGPTLEKFLQAEMDHHLGYEKHSKSGYNSWNSRNGTYSKKIRTTDWEAILQVPRDRNGDFEPQVIPKYQSNTPEVEQKIINMYALWLSTRDIAGHIEDIYGFTISADMVSTITDKILPTIDERQSRPLQACYPILFMDAIHCKVKENEAYVSKAVYMVVWYAIDGMKEVLGMYIGDEETSKFWQVVCNDLANRWVKDVCIVCVDGLPGFKSAIQNIFGVDVEIQRCIVHQIRNSFQYVSHQHLKEFKTDMAKIYKAVNLSTAEANLQSFTEKRSKLYPVVTKSWNENWSELSVYFVYTDNVRKIIYTTNIIESNNAKIRKVVRKWKVFPNEKSLRKLVYLAISNTVKKWTMPVHHRGQIINQLESFFPKISKYL